LRTVTTLLLQTLTIAGFVNAPHATSALKTGREPIFEQRILIMNVLVAQIKVNLIN